MQATSNNPVLLSAWPAIPSPRWLHWLALLTVLAAFPLLFLGAEVTTKGVGMADQRPVVNPLSALWEIMTGQQSGGWVIEHSHRLAGWFVGMCGIALATSLWLRESRRAVRLLGTAALLLIVVQGLLGIFRVQLNAVLGPQFAWVHGAFAPIVFATLTSVALVTSPRWLAADRAPGTTALRRWSMAMVGLAWLQIVLGGVLRHLGSIVAPGGGIFLAARGHLLGAFLVTAGILWLVKLAWENPTCRWSNRMLLILLGVQALLGVETWFSWMKRSFVPLATQTESTAQHWLRSGHYVIGAMLFATIVALMVQAHRGARSETAA